MLKRIFDLSLAIFALVLLTPILVLISLVIKLTSNGPIFYRGNRIGLNGIQFKIFKFRTMINNAEKLGGPSTAYNDSRLTKHGKFLRKYKLDELPQLFNIILGEMSFVGPRPQVEKYTNLYSEEEKIILSVKPGITDYASIELINLDEILGDQDVDEKYLKDIEPRKNKFRVKYAKEANFILDMKLIILTMMKMLKIK